MGTKPRTGALQGDAIRLGAIYNLQGAQASVDTSSADGAVLASLEVNRVGGIVGWPLQLLARDGMTEMEHGRKQAGALVRDEGRPWCCYR